MTVQLDRSTGPHKVELSDWVALAPFENYLNMEILKAQNGIAHISMPFYEEFAQGAGVMHGGALMALADTAMAMAIKTQLEPGTRFGTMKVETNFVRPVIEGKVIAKATVTENDGRTINGGVLVITEEKEVILEMIATFRVAKTS